MNEQEKFDDILRSKLTERDFPFDETNWDKAEGKIERSEKWRRYRIVSSIFLAGIGIGVAIMVPFINQNKTSQVVYVQSTQQNNNSNNNTIASGSSANKPANAVNSKSAGTVTYTNNSQPVVQANTNSSVVNNSGNAQPLAAANIGVTATPKTRHGRHHKTVVTDSTAQYSYVRPASERKSNRKTGNNFSSVNNNPNRNNSLEQNSGAANNDGQSNKQNTEGNSTGNTQPIANKNTLTTNSSTTNSNSTALAAGSKPDSASNTQQTATKKTDSSTNTTQISQPPEPSKKYTHTLFSIDAGGEYALGWKKEGGIQGSGFNPLIGFSVTHYFSHKISAFAGLQYNSLTNLNTLYSTSASQYDFGVSTNVNSITLQTIYYLALPVKFQYNITNNDMVSAGVSALCLLSTRSSVVSYNQNYFGTSGYTATEAGGYTDGLSMFDAQATLAYRRKIKRFTVSAEFYYGLIDIEENSFFNNNIFERNSGLRLFLSYDIIK